MNDYSTFAQDFGNPDEMMLMVFAIYGIIFGVIGLFALASFIIKGVGMYGIAKRLGIPEAWLAFIPIANNYLQGELAGPFTIGKKVIKNPGLWTLIYPFINGAASMAVYFIFVFSSVFSAMSLENSAVSDEFPVRMLGSMIFTMAIFVLVVLIGKAFHYAIYGLVRFKTHQRYMDDGKATVHMILGLFIPLYQSITYLRLSKKQPLSFDAPSAPFGSPDAPITHQPLPTINGESL